MDEKQLAALMCRYAPMVTAVVSGILGRGHRRDVEEVTVDVFYQFWRADKYDEGEQGIRNLLITIARRQAICTASHEKKKKSSTMKCWTQSFVLQVFGTTKFPPPVTAN